MMSFFSALNVAMLSGCLAAMQSWISVSQPRAVVDVELVLAVDTSGSMDRSKLAIQRQGYINAFRHKEFAQAVRSGAAGKIAVVYMEWAGAHYQKVLVPWTIIGGTDDANQFADSLAAQPVDQTPLAAKGTSISDGLLFAASLMEKLNVSSGNYVIDISGDGTNNSGIPIKAVRDALVAQGIIINGLPIILGAKHDFDYWPQEPEHLQTYFEDCVVGGPNSFVAVVTDMAKFDVILRRKLMREIVAQRTVLNMAEDHILTGQNTDCAALGERAGR